MGRWVSGTTIYLVCLGAAGASTIADNLREAMVSQPDFVVYVPEKHDGPDGANQHFLVAPTPTGDFLAFWTQATKENDPDQRVVMARSENQGRTWSRPQVLAGDPTGRSGRLASWQFPVVVPQTHRVYLFWNQNVGVIDAREDTTGALAYRWSDDDGHTWSEVHTLPIRKSAISNPEPGTPENWVVYQPPITTPRGEVVVGFTRWASRKVQEEGGLFDRDSEIWFLRFDNILTEKDGTRLRVTTLPEGQRGLRVPRPDKPAVSVAQEPTFQVFSDGRWIAVMRTRTGFIYYALSKDQGRTWDEPRPLRYEPGGEKVKQPLASSPLYKLKDGRFLLIFHNNDGTANGGTSVSDSRRNRRPCFLAVGREIDHPDHPIVFTRPRLLVDNNGKPAGPVNQTQIGTYPSLFEHGGKVYFWYPDRKHYLLGKILDEKLLDDSEIRDWKGPQKVSLRGASIELPDNSPEAVRRCAEDLSRVMGAYLSPEHRTWRPKVYGPSGAPVNQPVIRLIRDTSGEARSESYKIAVSQTAGRLAVDIHGADDAGLKFGVVELIHRLQMAPADLLVEVPLEVVAEPRFATRGMYAHLHWSYNRPYALRSWELDDWKRYIDLLTYLGFNTLQIWPMMELLPHPLSPEDETYLKRYAGIVDYAHEQRGMNVFIGSCPNNITENSRGVPIAKREYFDFEKRLDPGEPAELARILEYRSDLYRTVPHADGYWIIDSDPGGWKGSPSSEFVDILAGHQTLIDRHARFTNQPLIYWMWYGWGTGSQQQNWRDTLLDMKARLPEPWRMHVCLPGHLEVVQELGLIEKAIYFPYNLVETEPSGPLTELRFAGITEAAQLASKAGIDAIQGNAQTPLVQLPNIGALSYAAWGGNPATGSDEVLDRLARGLLAREHKMLKDAWFALSKDSAEVCTHLAARLRELAVDSSARGPLAVIIGEWQPLILNDLADMLEIRAAAITFSEAVAENAGDGGSSSSELTHLLAVYLIHAAAYLERTGYHNVRIITHESYRGTVTAALRQLKQRLSAATLRAQVVIPAVEQAGQSRSKQVCEWIVQSVLDERK